MEFPEAPLRKLIVPADTSQVIGLDGAVFPKSIHVFVPNSQFCQLKKEAVDGIFSQNLLVLHPSGHSGVLDQRLH